MTRSNRKCENQIEFSSVTCTVAINKDVRFDSKNVLLLVWHAVGWSDMMMSHSYSTHDQFSYGLDG